MNKKIHIILYIILIVLLSSFAFADQFDDNHEWYINCNDDITNQANNPAVITNVNAVTFETGTPTFNISGTGGTKYCNSSTADAYLDFNAQPVYRDYTVCVWVKLPNANLAPGYNPSLTSQFSAPSWYVAFGFEEATDTMRIYEQRGGTTVHTQTSEKITTGTWRHVCYTSSWNGNLVMYIDGGMVGSTAGVKNVDFSWASAGNDLHLGLRLDNLGDEWNYGFDEYHLWNMTLTSGHILNVTNYGDPTGPGSGPPTRSVSLNTPDDNNENDTATLDYVYTTTYYNASDNCHLFINTSGTWTNEGSNSSALNNGSTNIIPATLANGNYVWNVNCSDGNSHTWAAANYTITINVSTPSIPAPSIDLYSPQDSSVSGNLTNSLYYNASTLYYHLTNVSLYIDGVYNKSNVSTITNNANSSFLQINFTEGYHNWSIKARDNNTNETMSVNFTIITDISSPTIVTDFTNNTFFFMSNLTGQFNLTDNHLIHSINITLPNDNIIIYNVTGLNKDFYIYNMSYNLSKLSVGNHLMKVRVADAHTALDLGGEFIDTNGLFNDYLKYEFYDKGFISTELKDKSFGDSWTSEKRRGKYIQILEPSTARETQIFVEESDQPIYIVDHPYKYKGQWIVIGNHWKDYVLEGEEQSVVSIKRINLYKVEVTVSNIKNNQDKLTFASVGDLNIIERYYNFSIGRASITYEEPVLELTSQTMTLNISTLEGTTAKLFYNGSSKTSVKTTVGDYDIYTSTFLTPDVPGDSNVNISFYWNYNVSFGGVKKYDNITAEQTVGKLGLDNCSLYTIKAFNITIKRSDTEAEVNASLKGYFKIWEAEGAGNFSEFNLTWDNEGNYGVCVLQNRTFSVYAQLEYDNTDFTTMYYHLSNATVSNATNYLDLYFVPNSTSVTFSVTDQDDSAVEDVYISILQYDFSTNSYITTQVIKTNSYGEALGEVVLTTQWYKFLLLYENRIKLETEPIKITSTSRNFRIDLTTDFFELYETLDGVSTSLTYTNATRNFAYTFLNPTGVAVTGCLDIIERTTIADNAVNSSCVTSSAATILLNIGSVEETRDKSFIATGSIKVNPTWVTDILVASFDDGYKKFGKDGIFLSFMVRMTLAFVGLWNPIVAIMLIILADISMVAMGLYSLEWPTFMVYIILAAITVWRVNKN